jgi:hypothetical protein
MLRLSRKHVKAKQRIARIWKFNARYGYRAGNADGVSGDWIVRMEFLFRRRLSRIEFRFGRWRGDFLIFVDGEEPVIVEVMAAMNAASVEIEE